MRLEQLYYLDEIAKRKSINAAAAKLHLTQQSLSNSIQNLEIELNAKILIRSHRGVELTDNGEKILQTSREILAQWQTMKSQLTSDEDGLFYQALRVLASPRVLKNFLPKYINLYQKKYPDSFIVFDEEPFKNVLSGIGDYSDYDLILLSFYMKNDQILDYTIPENFTFIPIKQHELLLCTHKDPPLAELKSISSAKLRNIAIRIYATESLTEDEAELLTLFYRKLHLKYNVRYSDSISYCLQGVLDNMFSALCIDGTQTQIFKHPDTVFIPIKTDLVMQTGYLRQKDAILSPAALKFLALFNVQKNGDCR